MATMPPNPVLKDLEPLIGTWEVTVPRYDATGGRVSYEWLQGGAYVGSTSEAPDPFPSASQIIGRDDSSDTYTVLHYDSRGVSRVYLMTLDASGWRMWREAPGFWQRFEGRFSDDGDTITATWEKSPDGVEWQHDFDMVYTRA